MKGHEAMTTDESASALVPIEVRTVAFYGDEITGALVRVGDEPQVYVPIRPLCDYLRLDWSSQRKRINRDEVLRGEVRGVVIMTTPQGGRQEMLCLPLDLLPGWLFGITTGKIADAVLRNKITRYRRECYRRLWEAFRAEILPAADLAAQRQQSGAAFAYELATAVANLAREQMEAEQRLGGRIDNMARWAKRTDERISAIELKLANAGDQISEAQAAELALAVKNVAYVLGQQGAENPYGHVYGQLYRKFAVSTYKAMPRARFAEALEWLRGWLGEIDVGGTHAASLEEQAELDKARQQFFELTGMDDESEGKQ